MPSMSPVASPLNRPTGARRRTPIVGADIRAALLGRYRPELTLTRRALRVNGTDIDELIVVQARHEWWVGRRLADTITVWACQSELHAEATFDELLADPDDRGQWHEAHARSAA